MADLLHQRGERMQWYRDELLHMAKELGHRLLPAFNTTSGLPYPKVGLSAAANPEYHCTHQPNTFCAHSFLTVCSRKFFIIIDCWLLTSLNQPIEAVSDQQQLQFGHSVLYITTKGFSSNQLGQKRGLFICCRSCFGLCRAQKLTCKEKFGLISNRGVCRLILVLNVMYVDGADIDRK